ncbi:MAG: hypothetical protein ACLQDY_28445 [Streptosporangiaceae bacterium]
MTEPLPEELAEGGCGVGHAGGLDETAALPDFRSGGQVEPGQGAGLSPAANGGPVSPAPGGMPASGRPPR